MTATGSGWEGYVHMVQHKYNKKKEAWTKTNICANAAIYGKDGVAWAVSEGCPELKTYQHMQEMDDGGTLEVTVDEFQCAYDAAGGNRKPSAAGIRMGNEKYVFVRHDAEFGSTYMTRSGGGGAVAARTKEGLVIGFWNKDTQMNPKGVQNAADCGMQVEEMAQHLKDAGR